MGRIGASVRITIYPAEGAGPVPANQPLQTDERLRRWLERGAVPRRRGLAPATYWRPVIQSRLRSAFTAERPTLYDLRRSRMSMSEASQPRLAAAWTAGISFVLLGILSAYSAIFYAWIDVAAPGHGRLNRAMGIVCLVAVPGSVDRRRCGDSSSDPRSRVERAGRSR